MSAPKHTPGPWKANNQIRGSQITVHASGLDIAVVLSTLVSAGDADEVAPNSRLIAAAPDLLAALKEAADWARDNASAQPDWYVRARAAIAKAEGRSK